MDEQFVCTVCGYNMVERHPEHCPFCGASSEYFLTAAEVTRNYRVNKEQIHDRITMLRSEPPLGFEHAAYRITTDNNVYWIDCPSTFDPDLEPVDMIMYTHHHFLGAGNLYQSRYGSSLAIHREDSGHDLCRGYRFNSLLGEKFDLDGIHGLHINGHTPGFTLYRFADAVFLCDYVFYNHRRAKFNPYGPAEKTRQGGTRISRCLREWQIRLVCGFDYVARIDDWMDKFDVLLNKDVLSNQNITVTGGTQ